MMRGAAQAREAADFAVGHLVGPAAGVACADWNIRGIENDVGDEVTLRVQLSGEFYPVRTNPTDVAIVAHVHQGGMRIEDLHLFDTGGSRSDRGLRTWIVERAEWVWRRVNRGGGNPRAIERIEDCHRGAVGPSHHIDSAAIDFALGEILTDEMIDRDGV